MWALARMEGGRAMVDGPPVNLSPTTVCCPGHGEHLRAQWPKGFLVVGLALFQAAVASEAMLRECGWQPGKTVPIERVNEVIARRPLCYFVDRDTIRQAFHDSEIGTVGICRICGRSGLGGPYTVNIMGKHVEEPHVCFECALDTGERMHAAHPKGGVWHD